MNHWVLCIVFSFLLVVLPMEASAQQSRVLEAQKLLTERGYKPGTADGLMGPRTEAALRKFQTDAGLPVTGFFDEKTLQGLRIQQQPVKPKPVEPKPETLVFPIITPDVREPKTEQKASPAPTIAQEPAVISKPVPKLETPKQQSTNRLPQSAPAAKDNREDVGWLPWIIVALIGWWLFKRRKRSRRDAQPYELPEHQPSARAGQKFKARIKKTVGPSFVMEEADFAKVTWHPIGETVVVAGRSIDGLVYTGKPKRYQDRHNFMINPSLRVASIGYPLGHRAMPYWPDYSEIDTKARAAYLEWLADGRCAPDADVGYVFLFFYGLENRFFLEQPNTQERAVILQEVKNLLDVYGENGSVQRYLNNFIEFASLQIPGAARPTPVFERHGWEQPLMVRIALGAYAEAGQNIGAEWMLSWLVTHPEQRLRTPAKRCFDEFKALFVIDFNRKYPNGYKLRKPKKKLKLVYHAASNLFDHQLSGKLANLADVSALAKPVTDMAALAETVTQKLEKYSRYLGRNPDGRGTLEVQALLPLELREHFPSHELEELRAWVSDKIENSGLILTTDVIAKLEGKKPEKATKSQLISIADALARVGFGLAPDPRFALRAPKLNEPVVLFDLGGLVEELEIVSDTYRLALIQLALGAFVAHADGNFATKEQDALRAQVDQIDGLDDQEKRRLRANIDWFAAVPPDIGLLRRKLKTSNDVESKNIRSAVVAIALSDGLIRPEEVVGIEKIYKVLGLDPALVYSDLHAGDGPVRVKRAEPAAPGEAIPAEAAGTSIDLDMARIASIRSNTNRVSAVLGAVFADQEDASGHMDNTPISLLNGLNTKHTAMVAEIIEQDHWTEEAFSQLAAKHEVLISGALESINEWAYETYDEALLDAYEGFDVMPEIAITIKSVLEKEVQ